MTERPDPQSDLARLIAGEIEPDSPEGRRILAESEIEAHELEDLRSLARDLDAAAEFREAVAADAAQFVDAPGVDQVHAILRDAELPARLDGPTTRRGRRWVDWLLPVAALLLIVPFLVEVLNRDPGPGQLLSGGEEGVVIESPVGGPLAEYGPVVWSVAEPQVGDEVHLLVFDEEDELQVDPVDRLVLDRSPWSDAARQANWPDAVFLRLEVHRPAPDDRPSAWSRAWRSR